MDTKASTLDPALLQLVTAMNLFGTVYTVNAVAPIMKEQRSGKIITVARSPAPRRHAMAAMPITARRKPLSPTTPAIWPRTSVHSGSPRTASPPA